MGGLRNAAEKRQAEVKDIDNGAREDEDSEEFTYIEKVTIPTPLSLF